MRVEVIGTFIWGAVNPKPITNIPKGVRSRLRMRNNEFAICWLRGDAGISEHYIIGFADHWELAHPHKGNLTLQKA